jgi:hypothetical protein
MSARELINAIAVTAELTGTSLSDIAQAAMAQELLAYPLDSVLDALMRCRREIHGRLTLAAIIERLNANDGRPTADEAWMQALLADDERETVVWTKEAADAFFDARPALDAGDKIAARMAFKAAYDRLVQQARDNAVPTKWIVSEGFDVEKRRIAIEKGIEKKLLLPSQVVHMLPAPPADPSIANQFLRIASVNGKLMLENHDAESHEDAERRKEIARRELAKLRDMLKKAS